LVAAIAPLRDGHCTIASVGMTMISVKARQDAVESTGLKTRHYGTA